MVQACVEHAESIRDRRCHGLSLSLRLMASHTIYWGDDDHTVSSVLPSTPSIVSVGSLLSHERETSSAASLQGATGPARESLAKRMSSLLAKRSERETLTSVGTSQRADAAGDDSFRRHHKYFIKDGNVTFLVRGVQP